jgi:hypothetical protein
MSGELEAAGAAVTAGLVAGAIDSHGGEAHGDGACSNCGAKLDGKFCAACGQPAHLHRTLGHMVEEFLHGLLHFDTRAWRTLPMVIFRPGTLTRDYIHGKRARFISPLAMFLLMIFTMFAVFAFAGGAAVGVDPALQAEISEDIADDLRGPRPIPGAEPEPPSGETRTYRVDPDGDIFQQIEDAYARGDIKVNTSWAGLDKQLKKKLENPELAFYKIQNAAYKFAFLLVPISLPFMWLLFFWKRGLTLFDHTVYILYSLSFVSLLFITLSLLVYIPGALTFVSPWWIFAIPAHAYFQMKGGYSLGWFSALWRTPVLMLFASLGLVIFLVAIIVVGVTG